MLISSKDKNQIVVKIAIIVATFLISLPANAVTMSTTDLKKVVAPVSVKISNINTRTVGFSAASFTGVTGLSYIHYGQIRICPFVRCGFYYTWVSRLEDLHFDFIRAGRIWKNSGYEIMRPIEPNQERLMTLDLGSVYSLKTMAFWNSDDVYSQDVRSFELFADEDNIYDNGPGTSFLQGEASPAIKQFDYHPWSNTFGPLEGYKPELFSFSRVSTQYVHFVIPGSDNRDLGLGQIVFERVPFEFGPIPGVILIVTVGGINYFRNRQKGR